jgi:putative IMPACT (imprinted ancient) family translation regulator
MIMNSIQRSRSMHSMLGLVSLAAVVLGCGGAQLNQAHVAEVQSSVKAAEAVGANDQPKAALHLQLARDEMAEAERLAKDGDDENAELVLDRARADAELAMQLARTEQEQEKARQAWLKIRELEKEQR